MQAQPTDAERFGPVSQFYRVDVVQPLSSSSSPSTNPVAASASIGHYFRRVGAVQRFVAKCRADGLVVSDPILCTWHAEDISAESLFLRQVEEMETDRYLRERTKSKTVEKKKKVKTTTKKDAAAAPNSAFELF
jgi:hypothetical protein